jgi:hypothetical protein
MDPLSAGKSRWSPFMSRIQMAQQRRVQQKLPDGAEVATLGGGKYAASSLADLAQKSGRTLGEIVRANPALQGLGDAEFRHLPKNLEIVLPKSSKPAEKPAAAWAQKSLDPAAIRRKAGNASGFDAAPSNKGATTVPHLTRQLSQRMPPATPLSNEQGVHAVPSIPISQAPVEQQAQQSHQETHRGQLAMKILAMTIPGGAVLNAPAEMRGDERQLAEDQRLVAALDHTFPSGSAIDELPTATNVPDLLRSQFAKGVRDSLADTTEIHTGIPFVGEHHVYRQSLDSVRFKQATIDGREAYVAVADIVDTTPMAHGGQPTHSAVVAIFDKDGKGLAGVRTPAQTSGNLPSGPLEWITARQLAVRSQWAWWA